MTFTADSTVKSTELMTDLERKQERTLLACLLLHITQYRTLQQTKEEK